MDEHIRTVVTTQRLPSPDATPMVVYFGVFQRREFYASLLRSGCYLGHLRNLRNTSYPTESPEFDLVRRMDFSDGVEAIAEEVDVIRARWNVESLINFDEASVPQWADVCARLDLPAIRPTAARVLRDKHLMRRTFAEKLGVGRSARFERVTSAASAVAAAQQIGYPVIVKPTNLTGSFLVQLCHNDASVAAVYDEVEARLPAQSISSYSTDIPAAILVEEFLEGSNHSIDCVVADDRVWSTPIIDVRTGHDVDDGGDFHHLERSTVTRLTDEQQREATRFVEEAVRSLDVGRGALHVEFVFTRTGPRLVEIGGRPGTSRGPLLQRAFGINLVAAYRDVLARREPDVQRRFSGAAAIITPFPATAGRLVSYRGLTQLRGLPTTRRVDVYKNPGDLVATRRAGAAFPVRIQMHGHPCDVRRDLTVAHSLLPDLFQVQPARSGS